MKNEKKQSRDQWLHLRLTEKEKLHIHKAFLKTTQRKLSDYARKILLGKPMCIFRRKWPYDSVANWPPKSLASERCKCYRSVNKSNDLKVFFIGSYFLVPELFSFASILPWAQYGVHHEQSYPIWRLQWFFHQLPHATCLWVVARWWSMNSWHACPL